MFDVIRHHHGIGTEGVSQITGLLREVLSKLDRVLSKENTLMSQAEDLNNGLTALATGYAALALAQQAEMDALTTALAKVQNVDPGLEAAVNQAIANTNALAAQMAKDAAALTRSIPGATTVAPPPEATPPVVPPTVEVPEISVPEITAPAATPPSDPPPEATTEFLGVPRRRVAPGSNNP
jgi:hypothetical protein